MDRETVLEQVSLRREALGPLREDLVSDMPSYQILSAFRERDGKMDPDAAPRFTFGSASDYPELDFEEDERVVNQYTLAGIYAQRPYEGKATPAEAVAMIAVLRRCPNSSDGWWSSPWWPRK